MQTNNEKYNSDPDKISLNQGDETLCTYGAIFGVLITCTGLFQLLVFARFHWITIALTVLYAVSIITYVSLGLQKGWSANLVYWNILITLIIYIIYSLAGIWSLIVIILCAYNSAIASIALVEGLSKKLKERSKILQQEEKYWEGRL
jgi:hypothetical protein